MSSKKNSKSIITVIGFLVVSLLSGMTHADSDDGIQSTTARNETIVVEFFNKIFNERADVRKTANRYLTKSYIQHNPYVATGREAFIEAIGGWFSSAPLTRVAEIKRVISSGDLVMLHVHYHDTASTALGSATVDIFRVNKRGKIAEHWDVSQSIPDWMAHDNGMF